MKEWQQGFELSRLAELAAPFKQDFKPFVFGAFGIPKERDVAIYLKNNEVAWAGSPPAAVAIFKLMGSGSSHEDFCGRKAQIKAGDLFIKAIAGPVLERNRIVASLSEKSRAPTTWVECFAEDHEFVDSLRSSGFARVMTKIPASSELKLLMIRGDIRDRLPPPLAHEEMPALKTIRHEAISLADYSVILQELKAYEATKPWEQHYSSYNKRSSWTAFSLKGYDPKDPGFIIKPDEMSRKWKEDNPWRMFAKCEWTTAADSFQETIKILNTAVPGFKQRVRFMKLAPGGGELTRHADITDPEAGTSHGRVSRLHIPLVTNPGCIFYSWNLSGLPEQRSFSPRELFYLDTRKPHAVKNEGESERIHLVTDVYAEDWLREALRA